MECSRRQYVKEVLDCWRNCHGLSETVTKGQTGQNKLDGQQRWCLCWTLRNRGQVVKVSKQGRNVESDIYMVWYIILAIRRKNAEVWDI